MRQRGHSPRRSAHGGYYGVATTSNPRGFRGRGRSVATSIPVSRITAVPTTFASRSWKGLRNTSSLTGQCFVRDKVIHTIDRRSKPGCRVYRKVTELPKVLNGLGICVISTSKGVMSDRAAREQKVGGELLCTIS